jgi:thiosulfate reductase / polysulfide reductase chain A
MKRREFLKLSALLGTGASAPLVLTGCADPPLPGSGEVETSPTVCAICFWRCAGTVYREDGQPWKVVGHPQDLHSGGRLCTRGTGGLGSYKDPDRLRQPLLRVEQNGRQTFQPVSWDEALDYIAGRMRAIAEQHGEDRIALFRHGIGGAHFQQLLTAFGSRAVSQPSFAQCRGPRDVGFALTFGEDVGSPDRTDMEHSRCIVLIGSHLGENLHNGQVQTWIQALERGASLITVDPRFSVAAGKSRFWLPIRPGTDMALLLAWMHVLINERMYDQDYIARYATGFDQLAAHVQPFSPEWAFLETGISAEQIRETAREMAHHAPATLIHPGRHVTWYGDDTQRSRAIAILNALLGSWGRRGGFYIPEQVDLPNYPTPAPPQPRSNWREAVQQEYPLAPVGITNAIIDASIGPEAFFKGWFVYATNLPFTIPDIASKLEAAAQSLDLFVVIDTMPAEITGYADVVLPECTYLERTDPIRNNPERHPSLAVSLAAFEPRHESRPAWWMTKQIAERLGLGAHFAWNDYDEVVDWQLRQVGSSLEEMRRLGVRNFPRTTPMYFAPGEEVHFPTESGKIELHSQTLAYYGHDPLPVYTPPRRPDPGYYHLNYGRAPAHTFGRTINNPQLFELMPENAVWVNPLAAGDLGVKSGDYVRLKNQDGVISNRVRVRVTERIRPDSVYIVHGFGHTDSRQRLAYGRGADDNGLMTRVLIDPIMGGTGMRGNFVTLIPEEQSA